MIDLEKKKVTIKYSEYKRPGLYDPTSDMEFKDLNDLKKYYDEEMLDSTYPTWAFGMEVEETFKFDIEFPLEQDFNDFMPDADYPEGLVDLEGLIRFVDNWNKKQTLSRYYVDYKTVVLLKE